jgi:kinesin family protein 3/17
MASECVKVVVRCRPLNSKELADGRERIVDMDPRNGSVTLRNPKADASEPPKVRRRVENQGWILH